MKDRGKYQVLGTIVWLIISLGIGFFVWRVISNQDSSYKIYLVQSGSMEPAIMVGDVIVIIDSESYSINDVITFNDGRDKRTTHRIVEIKKELSGNIYLTKGDANRSGDRESVQENRILGKVRLTIPKLGYLINFLKTSQGFLMLIIFPAILIVVSEIFSLNKKNNN